MQRLLPIPQPLNNAPLWKADLSRPPHIAALGIGRHGKEAVEHYRLPGLWCLHLYRYEGVLRVQTTDLPLRPGSLSFVPPNTQLSHFFGPPHPPSIHLYVHFALTAANAVIDPESVLLPTVQNAEGVFEPLWARIESAMGSWARNRPQRAESVLWEALWQAAERTEREGSNEDTPVTEPGEPPAVKRAREIIEQRMGEPLRVSEIAQAVGLSHNHLTRLFRASTGQSVIAYLRERRVFRARHFLVHSTLPMKAIAHHVGLPDPHQFNKTVRLVLHLSPRRVRHGETKS